MIAKRIIACLDVKNGRVVKGRSFSDLQYAGEPADLAKKYYEEGADEIVFLDISASLEGRKTMAEIVEKTQEGVFIPLCVGGGVRSIEDAKRLLKAGADKIALNTAAVENPKIISGCAELFGSQSVVVAIDAKKQSFFADLPDGANRRFATDLSEGQAEGQEDGKREGEGWRVYTYGASKKTSLDAVEWAKKAEALGAGEILLTSIDCDGQRKGYDLELTREVSEAVNIPVIASGGAGELKDFLDVFREGKADAALVAGILHYGVVSIAEIKGCLKQNGIEVRNKW